MERGTVYSISISKGKDKARQEIQEAIITEYGIENDGHAGEWGRKWGRHISCLSLSSVLNTINNFNARPGEFDENIIIAGLDLSKMNVGEQLKLGVDVILEVTQIGKEGSTDYYPFNDKPINLGLTLLSYEGLFLKVVHGGTIKKGDPVEPI
ncbi:MAG TPA: MOSC domain-containing protein [Syntrophomonadaceae bacterium]|nr:MOSC domain-containing protein [Syntrophomonadaceae bacterium]